ncbi:tRNA lysidine(34) synthetase TilS [Cellvibrio sp. KY-YJ-3]|uniref:tRNA lysidine(34) synthetase TilS n=1 Tax=Cellvibrio sp. KY-YJ-3 TaxID=454662 RepID=UPI001248B78D|nr:tRNA lysidine(34) synthetase TilS [Cellvibrio sp. KY-YJ-3]QEY12428.1 tRNA lysidine(34) synthetase TilS [Cellvibrio sp. KY-YJ-3]
MTSSAPIFSPAALRAYLPDSGNSADAVYWVGFSGGLDSTVLLHALVQLQLPVTIRALHINHQISPHADQWQARCAVICAQLGIEFTAEKVSVINSGKGIEDAARAARYAVFESYAGAGDFLLTAHHANDQAETLLLRLLRGTGPRGLAAMAVQRPLGQATLVRPLLNFSRAQLESYAREHQLQWVEDESNQDDAYDRNFLRNQVLPLLAIRWPGFMRKWQQTAELCAEQELLLEAIAQEDLAAAAPRAARIGQSIDLAFLRACAPARQQNLLRYWLRSDGCSTPEQNHWQQIQAQLLQGREDAEANVTWGDVSLRVFRARLYLLPVPLPEMALTLIETSDNQSLRLKMGLPNLHIRTRVGGERCKPAGRNHSQTLKKLLQEYSLEPWLREQLPLVYSGDELVAVGDLWVCDGVVAGCDEAGYRLVWTGGAE